MIFALGWEGARSREGRIGVVMLRSSRGGLHHFRAVRTL